MPLGVESYVGHEGWSSKRSDAKHTNGKNPILGPGLDGQGSADTSKDDTVEAESAHNKA